MKGFKKFIIVLISVLIGIPLAILLIAFIIGALSSFIYWDYSHMNNAYSFIWEILGNYMALRILIV